MTLALPIASRTGTRSMDSSGWESSIRMLIVEDDLHVLAVLEDLFSGEDDLTVKGMSSSLEALALMRRQQFDLVITDLRMDGADGLEVARVAQETQNRALVIMVTGYASLDTTLEAIHLGVYDYITKPFQVDEFRLLVHNAATRIRLEREVAWWRESAVALQDERERLLSECDGLRKENAAFRRGAFRQEELEAEVGRPTPPVGGADTAKIGLYEQMAASTRLRQVARPPKVGEPGGSGVDETSANAS